MGIGTELVLAAFIEHAVAEDLPLLEREVAAALGVDTRRLAAWRRRSTVNVDELKGMVACWSTEVAPVRLVLHAHGLRVERSGVRDQQAPFRIAAPFIDGTGDHPMGLAIRAASAMRAALGRMLHAHPEVLRIVVLCAGPHGMLRRTWRSSVAFEVVRPPLRLAARTWQDQPLDAAYVDMLRRLGRDGSHRITTADLPPGDLRDVYEQDGFGGSEVWFLTETPTGVWYLSASATAGPPDLAIDEAEVEVLIRLCADLDR